MVKNYGEIENNLRIVNEDNFICGYDGITYNHKMADNAKQVQRFLPNATFGSEKNLH